MKKLLVVALASVLCAAFTVPASAVEHEFGGYWRTRAYTVDNWTGTDSGSTALVDTRTRLYYTAKFSDDFKLVNKFEFNNIWGDNIGGNVGTDGTGIFKIKHSYADFNTLGMNFKMGLQGAVVGRAFIFDDDFAGLVVTKEMGDNSFSATWMKVSDDAATIAPYFARNADTGDIEEIPAEPLPERDYYILSANLNLNDTLAVSPYLLFDKEESTDTAVYTLGADIDAKVGEASVWSSLAYQAGETEDMDNAGYLIAVGADAGIVHGQMFYASGDDDADDGDIDSFEPAHGHAYYWAEILGFGTFDNSTAFATSPNGTISNVMALNIGTTLKPMDKLTVNADLWYAQLVEDATFGTDEENELGIELDVKATYQVLDNLNLDLIAAYLIAGDAVAGDDTEDVMEYGARMSLSF